MKRGQLELKRFTGRMSYQDKLQLVDLIAGLMIACVSVTL